MIGTCSLCSTSFTLGISGVNDLKAITILTLSSYICLQFVKFQAKYSESKVPLLDVFFLAIADVFVSKGAALDTQGAVYSPDSYLSISIKAF